jgi:hypothetical protein
MEDLYAEPATNDKQRKNRRRSSSSDDTDRVSPKKQKRPVYDDFHLQASFPLGGGMGKTDQRETGGLAFGGLQTEEDIR